ncbi:MAG: outer membrane lipoprotein-sorting protein [Proteobacteria bacterium]|nr:outer membrane lipoprotein-sorting protein [Pseudomonadota bacterium]
MRQYACTRMKAPASAFSLLLLLSPSHALAGEADDRTPEQVRACIERNVPEPDNVRAIRITTRDRAGTKRKIMVKMLGHRSDDGLRRLLIRFVEPDDLKGAGFLIIERDGPNELYLASTEFAKPRRITGSARGGNLFGTDFTYEDFEYLQGFQVPGDTRQLEDSSFDLRPVYVVESRPEDSSYERVVSYIDKESCLPLQVLSYERGGRLRKELTTDPRWNLQHGDTWVAHETMMRDHRDLSTTHFLVDTHEQDALLPEGIFTVEGMLDPR